MPFITRYRKDQTGGLDEDSVRLIEKEIETAAAIASRKEAVLKSIDNQGLLTPEIQAAVNGCETLQEVGSTTELAHTVVVSYVRPRSPTRWKTSTSRSSPNGTPKAPLLVMPEQAHSVMPYSKTRT